MVMRLRGKSAGERWALDEHIVTVILEPGGLLRIPTNTGSAAFKLLHQLIFQL